MRKSVENLRRSKITGGRRRPPRTRRKYELDRYGVETLAGTQLTVTRRARGGHTKSSLKTTDFVNLSIPGSKVKRVKILKVLENSANSDYQRRGVICRGAILETEDGKCKVVSRPGQDGAVNAILIK